MASVGKITQIIGPVLDIAFPKGQLPSIYNALVVEARNEAGQTKQSRIQVQRFKPHQAKRTPTAK